MPDARLQKMRDVYPEQPQWRRPSENAAEQLFKRGDVLTYSEAGWIGVKVGGKVATMPAPRGRFSCAVTSNVIEGDQH